MAFSIVGPSGTDSTSQSLIWNGKRRHGPIGIVHPRWSMRDGAPGQSIRDGPSGMILLARTLRKGHAGRESPAGTRRRDGFSETIHPGWSIRCDPTGKDTPGGTHQQGRIGLPGPSGSSGRSGMANAGVANEQRDGGGSIAHTGRGKKVLFVDNRDSFVHTLGDYVRQTGADITTVRAGFPHSVFEEVDPDLVFVSPGLNNNTERTCARIVTQCPGLKVVLESKSLHHKDL